MDLIGCDESKSLANFWPEVTNVEALEPGGMDINTLLHSSLLEFCEL